MHQPKIGRLASSWMKTIVALLLSFLKLAACIPAFNADDATSRGSEFARAANIVRRKLSGFPETQHDLPVPGASGSISRAHLKQKVVTADEERSGARLTLRSSRLLRYVPESIFTGQSTGKLMSPGGRDGGDGVFAFAESFRLLRRLHKEKALASPQNQGAQVLIEAKQCQVLRELSRRLKVSSWSSSKACTGSAWPGIVCDQRGMVTSMDLVRATGSIPAVASQLHRLTSLSISLSNFSTPRQWQIGTLRSLQKLQIIGGFSASSRFQDLVVLSSLTLLEELEIQRSGFRGALPAELSALSRLTRLKIGGESLELVPDWITRLLNLQDLSIHNSEVYQEVPYFLFKLPRLTHLDLSANQLWGTLPENVFNSSCLQVLDLSLNFIEGQIPRPRTLSVPLVSLSMGGNSLAGTLPRALFQLPALTLLGLSDNMLQGPLPTTVATASRLTALFIGGNNVSGSFPTGLLQLSGLQILDLSSNNFQGSIPGDLSRMRSLTAVIINNNSLVGSLEPLAPMDWVEALLLSNNSFAGPVAQQLSSMRNLTIAAFDGNQLEGPFPEMLLHLPNLKGLSLARNRLSGSIPTLSRWFGGFMDLSGNSFSGPIPSFSQLRQLRDINLSYNRFTGTIDPVSFSSIAKLRRLSVRANKLTGSVPDVSSFPSLDTLDVAQNQLSSIILPAETSHSTIRVLDISKNRFKESIPAGISRLTSLTLLSVEENQFQGSEPADFSGLGSLVQLRVLLLGNNSFAGRFPDALCQLRQLQILSLRHNRFHGHLPDCVSGNPNWKALDLSHNYFYGSMFTSFASFPRALAINNNFFQGSPPVMGEGQPFCADEVKQDFTLASYPGPLLTFTTASSTAQNCFKVASASCNRTGPEGAQRPEGVCSASCIGYQRGLPCGGDGDCVPAAEATTSFVCICKTGFAVTTGNGSQTCVASSSTSEQGVKSQDPLLIAIGVTGLVTLAATILLLVFCLRRRRKQKRQSWTDLDVCKEYTLAEIEKATNSWSDENLLGEGGYGMVYAGASPSGEQWAVKRAMLITNDFEKEVRAMAGLNHPNLVRLLGYCMSYDACTAKQEQILVYEYAAKGDLRELLRDSESPVTLGQRLSFAIGVAEGLAYLHSFASPIVHRDVKPGNIVVDQEMRAKVADFGLLKRLSGDEATRIAGTPGYVDPEYLRSKVASPHADVYSFGIVLLEMITGRPVVCPDGSQGHIVEFCKGLFEASNAQELLDKSLQAPEEAVLGLTLVAMDCVRVPGMARPTMSDVVERLKALQSRFGGQMENTNPVVYSMNSVPEFAQDSDSRLDDTP